MRTLTRKDWILLVLLTIAWGINWPIMKLGVRDFPPVTFRAICMLGAVPVLWAAARIQGVSLRIPAGEGRAVLKLAIPNMFIWHACMIVGLKMLSSGRAAILGYTMPVWAVLFGLVFYGQQLTRLSWLAIALTLAGSGLLLSSELANLSGQPVGTLLALVAAAGWGYGTVLMKRTPVTMPTIALTFWMLMLTSSMMALTALLLESAAWRLPDATEWGTILYNILIVFGFAHVVWFQLARTLPPVASGLSVMMIPVLGVFSGAWWLNEQLHWQDFTSMLLILVAMSTVLLKPRRDGDAADSKAA